MVCLYMLGHLGVRRRLCHDLPRSFSCADGLTFICRNYYLETDARLTHGLFKDCPLISDQQNASFLAMENDALTGSPSLLISVQTAN